MDYDPEKKLLFLSQNQIETFNFVNIDETYFGILDEMNDQ